MIKDFEDKQIVIVHANNQKRFYIDLKETAKVLDVSEKTIMRHLSNHEDGFLEGEDYSRVQYLNSRNERRFKRVLYPEGFILMTMFVRSEVAARARKWAKKIIVEYVQQQPPVPENKLYAIRDMVDQMILQEERQNALEEKVHVIDIKYQSKFDQLEEDMRNSPINAAQVYHIKDIIDDIVRYATIKDGYSNPDKKHSSSVYGQFKHRFEISKYDQLARRDFDVAVRFLLNWRDDPRDKIN